MKEEKLRLNQEEAKEKTSSTFLMMSKKYDKDVYHLLVEI